MHIRAALASTYGMTLLLERSWLVFVHCIYDCFSYQYCLCCTRTNIVQKRYMARFTLFLWICDCDKHIYTITLSHFQLEMEIFKRIYWRNSNSIYFRLLCTYIYWKRCFDCNRRRTIGQFSSHVRNMRVNECVWFVICSCNHSCCFLYVLFTVPSNWVIAILRTNKWDFYWYIFIQFISFLRYFIRKQ